jgi:FkbM family methyltransferase
MLIDFRTLFPKYDIKPKGVLHVGANVGEEAPVYDELGIKKVIWVEANEKLLPQLSAQCRKFNHSYLHACISDVHGEEVTFNISNNAGQSSSILELGTHKTAHPEVHYVEKVTMLTKRLDCVFNSPFDFHSYDFLNIDLQGAELKALRGMGELLHRFKWAYLEVNQAELYKGCALVEDIDMYMIGYGFRRAETKWCGNTGWGDALYVKK